MNLICVKLILSCLTQCSIEKQVLERFGFPMSGSLPMPYIFTSVLWSFFLLIPALSVAQTTYSVGLSTQYYTISNLSRSSGCESLANAGSVYLLSASIVGQQVNTTLIFTTGNSVVAADQRNWGVAVTTTSSQLFRFTVPVGQSRCYLSIGVRAFQGSVNLYGLSELFNGSAQLVVSQIVSETPRSYYIGYQDYSNVYRLSGVNATSSCSPLTNTKVFVLAELGAGNTARLKVLQDTSLNLLTSVDYNWQETVTNVTGVDFVFSLSGGCTVVATVKTVFGSANLYGLDRLFDGDTSLVIPPSAPSSSMPAPSTTSVPSNSMNRGNSTIKLESSFILFVAMVFFATLFI